jgi:hypothetical protein
VLDPEWAEDGALFFVQDYPLPATVLGVVFDTDIGDDPD